MKETVELRGVVKAGIGWSTKHGAWERMIVAHEYELPNIAEYEPGTFNIVLIEPTEWRPPDDEYHRLQARAKGEELDINFLVCGNYVHPTVRVVSLNAQSVSGRVYYPGTSNWHFDDTGTPLPVDRCRIEVLSKDILRVKLGMENPDKEYPVTVSLEIEQ